MIKNLFLEMYFFFNNYCFSGNDKVCGKQRTGGSFGELRNQLLIKKNYHFPFEFGGNLLID